MLLFHSIITILVIIIGNNVTVEVKYHEGLVFLLFVILFDVTVCGRIACKQHFEVLFLCICHLSAIFVRSLSSRIDNLISEIISLLHFLIQIIQVDLQLPYLRLQLEFNVVMFLFVVQARV